jgi:hypothetical protein
MGRVQASCWSPALDRTFVAKALTMLRFADAVIADITAFGDPELVGNEWSRDPIRLRLAR